MIAFDYLCLMEDMIKLRARKVDVPVSKKEGALGLIFLSGSAVLMCPLNEITAIIPIPTFARVPKVKDWMIGVSNYRGEVLSITDLAGMLTSQLSIITKDSRVFVIANQDEYSGLLVNRVLGLQHVAETHSIDTLPRGLMGEYLPFVTGGMVTERFQLPIVSCHAIIRHPLFKNVVEQELEN